MRGIVLTVSVFCRPGQQRFAQATGQINGVVADNTAALCRASRYSRGSGTGISRDTVTAATVAIRFCRCGRTRTKFEPSSPVQKRPPDRRRVCRRTEPTLNITLSWASCLRRSPSPGSLDRRHHTVHALESSTQTHRRVASNGPGRGASQHSRARHGRHGGQSGVRENHPRRAAPLDHGTESRQASFRLDGTNIRTLTSSRISRPVPGRAAGIQHPDHQLPAPRRRERRRRRQRRHPLWNEQLQRRRLRLLDASRTSTRRTSFCPSGTS